MIIDVHTHCPPQGGVDAWRQFLDQSRRGGVTLTLVSSLGRWHYQPAPDEIHAANDEAAAFAQFAGAAVRWLVYLNPQHDNWAAELERGRAAGAVGVKLWVSLKDPQGRLDRTVAVIRQAAQYRLPVLLHTFYRTDGNLPGEITLEEFIGVAEQVPEAVLIAAHAGAHWRHNIGLLRGRALNAYLDIAGNCPEQGQVEALVRELGIERILFGSDMPGRSLPSQLAKVLLADLTEAEQARILWKNAAALFTPIPKTQTASPALRSVQDWPDFKTDHFCFGGAWPFFKTAYESPAQVAAALAGAGIDTAYTGDLGSVFRPDPAQANREWAAAARPFPAIRPLALVNPAAGDWPAVLADLPPETAGVILHPYLQNWRLDDPAQAAFFKACAQAHIPLWINTAWGDHRFRPARLICRPVAAEEVLGFAKAAPANHYVFQGLGPGALESLLKQHSADRRFQAEISRLTDLPGVWDRITGQWGSSRLVLGSEFPLRDIREVRWALQRL